MRLSQNDKLRTQLESKMGSEASNLQEEQNKLNKDNIMMKKLMEDFNNISNQIKGLLNLIEEKRNKTAKNEELKKASENTKEDLDKNFNDLQTVEKNILKRTEQAKDRIEEIKAKYSEKNRIILQPRKREICQIHLPPPARKHNHVVYRVIR